MVYIQIYLLIEGRYLAISVCSNKQPVVMCPRAQLRFTILMLMCGAPTKRLDATTMMNLSLLRYALIVSIGLQLDIAAASSACNSLSPSLSSPTFRSPVTTRQPSVLAFATRQSYRYTNRHSHGSIVQHTMPSDKSISISSSRIPQSSTRLFMLPEHLEHLSVIAPLTFWPVAEYLYDLATFMLGLSFMFAATSFILAKPQEVRGEPALAMAADGNVTGDNSLKVEQNDNEPSAPVSMAASVGGAVNGSTIAIVAESDNELQDSCELGSDDGCDLTPSDYADSNSAKNKIQDTILTKASEAFDATDFAHEPHLSPDVEDAEAAFEVALLANAAHELVEAAEKENRQSKAAMLEREKELEWIEKHDSLLAEQLPLDNKSDGDAKKKRDAFQRSLLSARIANDDKAKKGVDAIIVEQQLKQEFMGSEVLAASMGAPGYVPVTVASAAASSAVAQALAAVEAEEGSSEETAEEDNGNDRAAAPAAVASAMVADTAERMILGEDIAFLGHTPESQSVQPSNNNEDEQQQQVLKSNTNVQDKQQPVVRLLVNDAILSEADRWRKDYVDEVRQHVQKKAIEQTKKKISQRNSISDGGDVDAYLGTLERDDDDTDVVNYIDTITSGDTSQSEELVAVQHNNSERGESVIKRTLQRGFMKSKRQRKQLLIVALAVVASRRLFLAYFGNALRLI